MKIYQGSTSGPTEMPQNDGDMVNKAYVDQQITSASVNVPLFFTDVQPAGGSGIVALKQYVANTVPANAVITECTTDEDDVTVSLLIEPGFTLFSPTVTITADVPANFNGGSPVVLDASTGMSKPGDDRQFVGTFTANVTDTVVLTATSSAGGVATATINRAGVGPAITTLVLDPESAQGAGITHVKNGDTVSIASGSVPNDAVAVEIIGASELANGTTALTLGADDSAGAGFKTISGSFTVAGATNGVDRTILARAKNALGTYGVNFETNGLDVDNNIPQFSGFSVTYPATQGAIKSGEQATVALTVTDFTGLVYSTPTSQVSINGGDTTTYESKVVDYVSGSYNVSSNNYRVVASKATNGTSATYNGVVKIANVAPTAALSIDGSPSRLTSAVGGTNYTVRLNPNQDLIEAPNALVADEGTFTASWVDASGDNWTKTLTITDAHARGTHTFNSMQITGLSGIVGTVITSGSNYTIGGFSSRVITVPAFSQSVQLPAEIGDVTKVTASYYQASALIRQTDLSDVFQGFSFADRFGDDANAVYDDTNPTVLWLSDVAFAGANTTGTLQIQVEETA
jgi:hypothetical protein